MKKLPLLLLFIAFTFACRAQDSKPTKEQTIAYLRNILLNPNGVLWTSESGQTTCRTIVTSITFAGCSMIIETNRWCSSDSKNEQRKTIYTVDFSQVEKVDAEGFKWESVRLTAKDHELLISVKFTYTDASGKETVTNSFEGDAAIPCPLEKEKIIKAFNHLRKLCGAPEPITF